MTVCAYGTCTAPTYRRDVCQRHYEATLAAGRRALFAGTNRLHGTRSAYTAGCRCQACRRANAAYSSGWKEGPRQRLLNADPIRDHVRRLVESGWTPESIALHTGYGLTTIRDIQHGKRRRIYSTTAMDLLSVQPKQPMEAAS